MQAIHYAFMCFQWSHVNDMLVNWNKHLSIPGIHQSRQEMVVAFIEKVPYGKVEVEFGSKVDLRQNV